MRMGRGRQIALLGRALRYLWAFPVTVLGLLVALLALLTGGTVRRHEGTLEVHSGFAYVFLGLFNASALTLGHVILGFSPHFLAVHRAHEREHVRQCERWGIFFLPAYFVASLWAWSRGGHYYRDNGFEVGAMLLAVLIANHVTNEGESTWFEGLQLLAVYVVLGLTFLFAGT